MFAGYDSKYNPENLEAKNTGEKEAELTPEQLEYQEKMADMPEFGAETPSNETEPNENNPDMDALSVVPGVAAAAIAEPLGAFETPNAPGKEAPNNADGENLRRAETVTEQTARDQIKSNDINAEHLVQNVAGNAAGGREAIIQDGSTAASNMAQAELAANSLNAKVADGESDGTVETENALVAAMTSAADAKVTAEKAALESINNSANAKTIAQEAQSDIERTKDLADTVQQAASVVQDPELAAKAQRGAQDIQTELAATEDLLATAVEQETQEETEEDETDSENNRLYELNKDNPDAADLNANDMPKQNETGDSFNNAAPNTETLSPGQVNAEAVKKLRDEQVEKQKAAEKAIETQNKRASNEQLENRQQF